MTATTTTHRPAPPDDLPEVCAAILLEAGVRLRAEVLPWHERGFTCEGCGRDVDGPERLCLSCLRLAVTEHYDLDALTYADAADTDAMRQAMQDEEEAEAEERGDE